MLSILAGGHPPKRSYTASHNPVLYEDGRAIQEFHSKEASKYFVTLTVPPKGTPTMFNPPLHFHSFQSETFTVRKGIGHYFINTQSRVPDPKKPIVVRAGESIDIPIGSYHRFESADTENALVVDILLSPDTREVEFSFFRNFFGYMEDCRTTKTEPSLFQMLRFMYEVSGPLAVPLPVPLLPAFVGRSLSWALISVGGLFIGEWLLGYKGSYDAYYKKESE